MQKDFDYDVFLSYSRNDLKKVRRLAEKLKRSGLRVWFDEWLIASTQDEVIKCEAIEQGLQTSRCLILCMSPSAVNADWSRLEPTTIRFRFTGDEQRRFLPLLLEECKEIPESIRRYHRLDGRSLHQGTIQQLLEACGSTVAKRRVDDGVEWLCEGHRWTAHRDDINSIALVPHRDQVLTASNDCTLKLWNPTTGEEIRILKGHAAIIRKCVVAPDGRTAVSASDDNTLRVWDLTRSRSKHVLRGHDDLVWSVAILPDGRSAVSGGDDGTLRIWELTSGKCRRIVEAHAEGIIDVCVSDKANLAFTASRDHTIRIWDIQTWRLVETLLGHGHEVDAVTVSHNGQYLLSTSEDRTIRRWDIASRRCIGCYEGHTGNYIFRVAFVAGDAMAVSAGSAELKLWDMTNGRCLQTIAASFYGLCASPASDTILAGEGGEFVVYRFNARQAAAKSGRKEKTPSRVPTTFGDEVKYSCAKVVLVGASGVGKTTLAHRLVSDKFVKSESTHGMQVWRVELPIEPISQVEREVLLWDLAGQQDYRLMHQLFLDQTDVALLLLNAQADDPFSEADDWLKALDSAMSRKATTQLPPDGSNNQNPNARRPRRACRVILVAARVDVGTTKVSQRKIDAFLDQNGLDGYIETSAKTGRNCSEARRFGKPSRLKELIAENIPWDDTFQITTPRLLQELKNAVVAMTEDAGLALIRLNELRQRLQQGLCKRNVTMKDARTAVELLATQGIVKPLEFGQLVLLRPELLNTYGAAVVREARTCTDEMGAVGEKDVLDGTINLDGIERIDEADEQLLLRALIQTFLDNALCIKQQTEGGTQLIFPSQFRRDRPIPSVPECLVSFTFAGELQTAFATLVVRLRYGSVLLNPDIPEIWQNAAEFATPSGAKIGFVLQKTKTGHGRISVFADSEVSDDQTVVFIRFVYQHLQKHDPQTRRERQYACPMCGRTVTDTKAVQERLHRKLEFIICPGCDHQVPLIDFIEEGSLSDDIGQFVRRMRRTAKTRLDHASRTQQLLGHLETLCYDTGKSFRPMPESESGIHGIVESCQNGHQRSGRGFYVHLKFDDSFFREQMHEGRLVLELLDRRYLKMWRERKADVYLVVRTKREHGAAKTDNDAQEIQWMNLTERVRERGDDLSSRFRFEGVPLDGRTLEQACEGQLTKTVVVVDLSRYTKISDSIEGGHGLGTVGVELLNERIQELIRGAAKGIGDKEFVKPTGDGAILLFDSPISADRFGERLHRLADEHNVKAEADQQYRSFRIGISSGEISQAAGEVAGTAIGNAVRLEAKAITGEILMDEDSWSRLTDEQKKQYGAAESVKGKPHDREFRVRRRKVTEPAPWDR